MSARSIDEVNVQVIMEKIGGGGHLNAAGGEFYGTLDDAAALFRSILEDNKKKYIAK